MYRWIAILLAVVFFLTSGVSFAQESDITIAVVQVVSGDVHDGDIVAFNEVANLYELARGAPGEHIFGVVSPGALLIFRDSAEGVPVARDGMVLVNVTTLGGDISTGDRLAPSAFPGKAARATEGAPNVIGTALESFSAPVEIEGVSLDTQVYTGTIKVLLENFQYLPPATEPLEGEGEDSEVEIAGIPEPMYLAILARVADLLRILGALAFVAIAVFVSYRLYERQLITGVESLGRNPLAMRVIRNAMVMNVVVIGVLVAVSIGIGLLIIFFI